MPLSSFWNISWVLRRRDAVYEALIEGFQPGYLGQNVFLNLVGFERRFLVLIEGPAAINELFS